MAQQFGLTPLGFVPKQQQQIKKEIEDFIKEVFGQNTNLNPESNFGQLCGYFSEREALIWQLGDAIYASQYPGGAEGTSVDNILALNNLRRLEATPTRTALASLTESNGITFYPLLVFGTAGTVVPAGSGVQTDASPPLQFTIDSSITIQAAVNAIQGLFFSNVPDSGNYSLAIQDPDDNILVIPTLQWNSKAQDTLLEFSAVPAAATSFKLALSIAGNTLTTAAIPTPGAFPTAGTIQTAIQALIGYSGVTVSGGAGSYVISWGSIPIPITTVTNNTTTVTITPNDSVQAAINSVHDTFTDKYPYTDVVVTVNASGFNFNFGAGTPVIGQPVSSAQPQALITISSNTLMNGTSVTNLLVGNTVVGAKAQGQGAATCIQTGPNFVAAGNINTITTPISGWTGVENQLDCLTGTNVEDDTEALVRREVSLNENANGPLLAIIEKVSAVPNVTIAIGFQNLNIAAIQVISFASIPVAGTYKLLVNGNLTAPIAYNATAAAIQAAVQALPGLSTTLVSGTQAAGFMIDFNGSFGGQQLNPIGITANTTSVAITQSFGRPGKSVEIVAEGGDDTDIAEAILASKPAGIQTYGSTTVTVYDSLGNPYHVSFSRPTQVPIYIVVSMITDIYNIPGDNLSGLNPNAKFDPSSISTIQLDLVTIGKQVPIGGTVIGFGTHGLIGAFNDVPGIVNYTLFFGDTPNPTTNTNISLLSEQAAIFETFNIAISYT